MSSLKQYLVDYNNKQHHTQLLWVRKSEEAWVVWLIISHEAVCTILARPALIWRLGLSGAAMSEIELSCVLASSPWLWWEAGFSLHTEHSSWLFQCPDLSAVGFPKISDLSLISFCDVATKQKKHNLLTNSALGFCQLVGLKMWKEIDTASPSGRNKVAHLFCD